MGRKKKQPAGAGRAPSRAIFARINPELGAALERYLASLRPAPTATAVITVALEMYLEGVGFWPPPREPSE